MISVIVNSLGNAEKVIFSHIKIYFIINIGYNFMVKIVQKIIGFCSYGFLKALSISSINGNMQSLLKRLMHRLSGRRLM